MARKLHDTDSVTSHRNKLILSCHDSLGYDIGCSSTSVPSSRTLRAGHLGTSVALPLHCK